MPAYKVARGARGKRGHAFSLNLRPNIAIKLTLSKFARVVLDDTCIVVKTFCIAISRSFHFSSNFEFD